ncbi:MAG TPA: hypothetical protein VF677_10505 [Flavobacterium sp.]
MKIKSKIYCITMCLFWCVGCKQQDSSKHQNSSKHQDSSKQQDSSIIEIKKNMKVSPLVFNVIFENFGKKSLAINDEETKVDSLIWADHKNDSIIYFKTYLKNIYKKPFVLKTGLVATRIPFLLKYSQQKNNTVTLVVVHQFNTIYADSLVFKKNGNGYYKIKEAYTIGYYHNGVVETSRLHPIYKNDTLDITNEYKR